MEGISKKIYLELEAPSEEDSRSSQMRILDELEKQGMKSDMTADAMRMLYPLCEDSDWKITVSLAWNGYRWMVVKVEAGDRRMEHYGLAVDLGSTTVVARLVNCETGESLGESSSYNRQIAFGTDILTRIFYCKDDPRKLEELRQATLQSIVDNLENLKKQTGISWEDCIQMVIAGNMTMIHFLIGMDAFCVFHTPYAVRADQPGFIRGSELLGIPLPGYVFCCPGKSNYLGGDIISGVVATQIYREEDITVFFDIGTNGELVVGNKEFLLCGAGAAGPALEGGVVETGMRAAEGAVERVRIQDGKFINQVIGGGKARGICGSGIIDLLAELFLNGWIDIRGKLIPEKSDRIQRKDGMYGVEYAPGLIFWQNDIDEFIKTKAAAYTMVEYVLNAAGISMDDIGKFYVAGSFGKHVSKESAVAIGMYPDLDRERLISAGNASLEGASMILLHREYLNDIQEILNKMVYIQFGAVEDFLHMMVAAQALPHTDMRRYPSVMEKLKEREDSIYGLFGKRH
ncbi:MAG: ASKHA domain-containing protein [Ruminococcus sp.]|jgi:uncharacterized 2Fe-2S/4Fe-4S cluster protein (DUF4445 family)